MTTAHGLELSSESLADLCRRYQVRSFSLFGSAARGELKPSSDIDILVEFLPNHTMDLIDFGHLEEELSQLVACPVDLVSSRGINPSIAPYILRDARLLYAA